MIDRSRIGFSTDPTTVAIDAWRVKLFCQATGEADAVYWEADAANAAGHPACPIPPTYLKAIEGEHYSSAQLMKLLKVPMRGVLHAEQSFDLFDAVHVGDSIEVSRMVTDIHDKKDGAFTFIVLDTTYRRASLRVASSRQTVLVRNTVDTA